jgi:hypothetical protein
MAVIYMSHPVHGAKVAIMEEEAIFDEKNGWTRYTLDTPSESEDAAPPVNALGTKRKYVRKVETETATEGI